MGLQTRSPARGVSFETSILSARYLGGGAATDCTKIIGRGITSVKYNAATGNYRITFSSVGRNLIGVTLTVVTDGTTAGARVANPKWNTYNAANMTLDLVVVDAATPTATDLTTSNELHIVAIWADTEVP